MDSNSEFLTNLLMETLIKSSYLDLIMKEYMKLTIYSINLIMKTILKDFLLIQ